MRVGEGANTEENMHGGEGEGDPPRHEKNARVRP